jgi:alpha-1,3-mannosyltransferase
MNAEESRFNLKKMELADARWVLRIWIDSTKYLHFLPPISSMSRRSPSRGRKATPRSASKHRSIDFTEQKVRKPWPLVTFFVNLLTNWDYFTYLSSLVILGEIILQLLIIWNVKYTEIDWKAYMQEVEGWLVHGEYDYTKLRGDTGPLVYPAGFLYVFAAFRYIGMSISGAKSTDASTIRVIQYLYIGVYVLTLWIIHKISSVVKLTPPWFTAIGLSLSYRLHSLYVLRLFNDTIAVLFYYVSLYLFSIENKWYLGAFFYSLAVSVKMNIILMAPGLLLLFLLQTNFNYFKTIRLLFVCGIVQLILGYPFLSTYPVQYLTKAFELSRVFTWKWSVNFKFLPIQYFESKYLAAFLLICIVVGNLYLLCIKYFPRAKRAFDNARKSKSNMTTEKSKVIVLVLSACNFLGIAFARTIHYQFYTWYFHTLPWLLWNTFSAHDETASNKKPIWKSLLAVALLALIEVSFNGTDKLGEPRPEFALLLQVCHGILVAGTLL